MVAIACATFCTYAAELYTRPNVQDWLGHQDIQTIMRHVHAVPQDDGSNSWARALRRSRSRTASRTASWPIPNQRTSTNGARTSRSRANEDRCAVLRNRRSEVRIFSGALGARWKRRMSSFLTSGFGTAPYSGSTANRPAREAVGGERCGLS